jgi:hypothetical protein
MSQDGGAPLCSHLRQRQVLQKNKNIVVRDPTFTKRNSNTGVGPRMAAFLLAPTSDEDKSCKKKKKMSSGIQFLQRGIRTEAYVPGWRRSSLLPPQTKTGPAKQSVVVRNPTFTKTPSWAPGEFAQRDTCQAGGAPRYCHLRRRQVLENRGFCEEAN